MIITVAIVLSALAAIGGLIWGIWVLRENDRESRLFTCALAGGVGLISAVLLFFSTFTVIGGTEVGVPITFGTVGTPMTSGVNWKAPWASIESFPVRPFAVPDVEITARTSQAGQVKATVGARWHVLPERARETYLQIRSGDEDKITKEVVDKALGQAVGNVFVEKDNLTATTDRQGIESALLVESNRLVAPFGITIDNVFVRAVEPDQTTAAALARVASQQRETEIAIQSQQTATAQAKARLIEAQGLHDAAAQLPSVTAEQVAALCLQTWERMAAKAITAGVPLYTSPCGSSSVVIPGGAK